jgi:hypothetical protein
VRDVIEVARRGKPAVALVTQKFFDQGNFVAKAAGMPDVPRIMLPHPTAGRGEAFLSALAAELAPRILEALTNPHAGR